MEEINEWQKGENKTSFIKRNIKGIKKIVDKHKPSDSVICITSGVNLTAFVCYFVHLVLRP